MRARVSLLMLALCGGCLAPWTVPRPGGPQQLQPTPTRGGPRSALDEGDASQLADGSQESGGQTQVYTSIGAFHADGLRHVRTADTDSSFDPWGFSMEAGFTHFFESESWFELGVGLEGSVVLTDLDGSPRRVSFFTTEEGGTASLFRLTPTVAFRVPFAREDDMPRTAIVATGGAGYYGLRVEAEQTTSILGIPSFSTRTLLDDSTFGAFVGIGLQGMDRSGRAGAFVDYEWHFAEFDTNDAFVPPNGKIRGPMQILQVGLVFAF